MIIKIETCYESEYEPINELYGTVLQHFNFYKDDNAAFIELNTLEDVDKLDSMLWDYVDNYEGDNKHIYYFGLLFTHFYDNLILIIKDDVG